MKAMQYEICKKIGGFYKFAEKIKTNFLVNILSYTIKTQLLFFL